MAAGSMVTRPAAAPYGHQHQAKGGRHPVAEPAASTNRRFLMPQDTRADAPLPDAPAGRL